MSDRPRLSFALHTVAIAAILLAACAAPAATTIDVSNSVLVPSVKRFGLNLGYNAYWDGQIVKNLIFDNPAFEGLEYRSVVSCTSGTDRGCTDSITDSVWPSGFWNGASYEFIYGTAKGRSGTIVSSSAPTGSAGTSYTFAESGVAPASGDYMVLRKTFPGGAEFGWFTEVANGGTVTTELSDLPPGTEGQQAVRLSTTGGGTASITAPHDNVAGLTFLQLSGAFRLTFKAKGAGGNNALDVSLQRSTNPSATTFIGQTLTLTPVWTTYTIDFLANERGTSIGTLDLRFSPVSSTVLIDDVSLVRTDGDPANTTAFRDPVVNALRIYRPGILRYLFGQYGDSLDNQIAPPFARRRTGYSSRATANVTGLEYGLHEFLQLCEAIGTEPWYVFSVAYSTREMANLIEYLAGPATSPYGAKRAARGRAAPWTDAFSRIHLEFGNEAWNDGPFQGAAIVNPIAYGTRGSEIFTAARNSPYFVPSKFDLILGGQAEFVARNCDIHGASVNNDTLAVAPYLAAAEINAYATNEQLFGSLFAEPEMFVTTGAMRQNYDFLGRSSRPVPLSIYEVNVDATLGSISQAALDSFTPSLGAGVAVADHMLLMLRELGIRDQNLFSLSQYSYQRSDGKEVRVWGVTRDMGVTDRKRPQFLALKMANDALAGDLVRTTQSGDDPRWNQPLLNGVSLNNAHYIQSFALVNGNSRSIILFNLHRTSDLDVNFTGPNAPAGTVTLKRLSGPAITANNEDSETVVVGTETLNNFNPSSPFHLPPYSMSLLQWSVPAQHRRAARH